MAGCREAGDTDCISAANLALSPGTLLPPPHSNMFSAKACIKPAMIVGCCHFALLSVQSQAGAFSITRVTVADVKRVQDNAKPQKYLQMQYDVVAMSLLQCADTNCTCISETLLKVYEAIRISSMFSAT